jgi:hypothetical protein
MKVYATRDSVALGDDIDAPHERVFSFPDALSPLQVISRIVADGYLARIAGGQATWSAVSGVPLAVVAQQWTEPRGVPWQEPPLSELEQQNGMYRIHFNYHVQRDPELVLEVLKELKFRAP